MDIIKSQEISKSKISIIIPYYNQPEQIRNCLAALKPALSDDDEIIIVDDASSLPLAFEELNKPYIRYIRLKENQGPSAARNKGVEEANNELIAFMDADDIALPERFSAQAKALERHPKWIACVGGYIYLRKSTPTHLARKRDSPPFNIRRELISGKIYAAGSTLMFRRSSFLKIGGYNPVLRVYEDWDLLLRAINSGTVGHCGSQVSIIIGSTRRADLALRMKALKELETSYSKTLSPPEGRLFLHALSYEKASALFRSGSRISALAALTASLYYSPRKFMTRISGRLLFGTP